MMFFKEHNPAHFHAKYEGSIAVFEIKTGKLMAGSFPPRAMKLVKEWIKLHKKELLDDWNLLRKNKHPKSIEPLP
jgi:hypothetical protein